MTPSNRRYLVVGAAAFVIVVAAVAGVLIWQNRGGEMMAEQASEAPPAEAAAPAEPPEEMVTEQASETPPAEAAAAEPQEEMMAEQADETPPAASDAGAAAPLSEMTLGSPDAPVTVIEYASFSCPHCAHFHNDIFDSFKLSYIDTGEVHFVFREYLRNGVDVAISAVARCAPADRYFDVVDSFFSTQDEWLKLDKNLRQAILDKATTFGFTEASFDACLKNQALLDGLDAGMSRAQSAGVTGTPTFFINGEMKVGALPMDEWDAIIKPLVAAGE
jgi:protein-disulfide isomerase